MDHLRQLIVENEDWLMHRIIQYAKEHDYLKYTSTLAEAWRISIDNLSQTILTAVEQYPNGMELSPDEDYTRDPIASFGIHEAQKHRSRGLTLGMFLSLLKYYRQCYIDLIRTAEFDVQAQERYRRVVNRCFDRIELGLCTEWSVATNNERMDELQASNRVLANEKNKYLTIFESLHDPVILLDSRNRVTNMNHAAARLLIGEALPGDIYYDPQRTAPTLPWLDDELSAFTAGSTTTLNFEKSFNTAHGLRYFHVKLERMLDISEKYSGVVVLLSDVTERKRAAVMAERERLARELHDSVTQSLYSLSLFAEWGSDLLAAGELEPARERMARMGDIAQQALREMRLLLYELRPSALDEDGLVGALQSRLEAVEQRVGIETKLQANLSVDLPSHVEECLYRIAQEALNNALKHAEADTVSVHVQADETLILLEVSDSGIGFDPARVGGEGRLGLANIRARAERLGGACELISSTGQGTTVRVSIAGDARTPTLPPSTTMSLTEVA